MSSLPGHKETEWFKEQDRVKTIKKVKIMLAAIYDG
jgi:hypothetical protein